MSEFVVTLIAQAGIAVIWYCIGRSAGRRSAPTQADLAAAHCTWQCVECGTKIEDVPIDGVMIFIDAHMASHGYYRNEQP